MMGVSFRYLLDPLFLLAVSGYAVNKWFICRELAPSNIFVHGYLNDLLLIPAALPPLLFVHRKLGIRVHDDPPSLFEIGLHAVIWSVFLEIIGPPLYGVGTADLWDAVAYATGGLLAWCAWRGYYNERMWRTNKQRCCW